LLPRHNQQRLLRLYEPAATGQESTDAVSSIRLYPNVTFWGTINYDETTERLSPRLLDRTGIIFLTEQDVSPSVTTDLAPVDLDRGLRASQLINDFRKDSKLCPEESWEVIEPVLQVVSQENTEWGPGTLLSPRLI